MGIEESATYRVPAGTTRCFDIPPSLLATEASLLAIATPLYAASNSAEPSVEELLSQNFDSASYSDSDKWDLDHLSDLQPVYDDPQFLFSMDPILENVEMPNSADQSQRQIQHSSLRASVHSAPKRRRTDIQEGLDVNEEQRIRTKDIDWDALLGRSDTPNIASASSKISACLNVPLDPPSGFELRFEPWEMDQNLETGLDGGVINWH